MSDRYTQMAVDFWAANAMVVDDEINGNLAALLRRVDKEARIEQIEEDADWLLEDTTCQCTDGFASRDLIDPSCYFHDMLGVSEALLIRAKELEN